MNIIDFFLLEQKRLHSSMHTSVSELSLDEWHHVGQGKSNSISSKARLENTEIL